MPSAVSIPTTLFSIIADHAAARPDAAALETVSGQALSYRQAFEQMQRTRRALRALGIRQTDRLATVLPDGPDAALAFLSVAACAVAAPLNPAFRATRYPFYLQDIPARALLVPAGSGDEVEEVARTMGIPVIELVPRGDGTFDLRCDRPAAPIPSSAGDEPADDAIALVLYTSGSTARPKLVPLTHGNLAAGARFTARALELRPSDRALHLVPMFHVQGLVTTLLAPLSAGGTVICAQGFQPGEVLEQIERTRPTWYTAVPTMHHAIVERAHQRGHARVRSTLRFVRSSAAALGDKLRADLEQLFGVPVVDGYGMTEASPIIASTPLPPRRSKRRSVGLAAGPEVAILDETGRALGANAVGEIAIRGDNVMKEYDRNPEATAAAFVNGWFRTGDQGYRDEDGFIFLTGRLKEIINRGGEKIAPGEVEEVLIEHPAVAEAVVFGVPDARLGHAVGAAVVLRAGAQATEQELREFTSRRLAFFKIPARVLFLDALPTGPTGKLQRIGLAEKLGLRNCRPVEPLARQDQPGTALEQELAALWRETLGVDRVGVHDNFFVLGGDSISFVEMLYRVRQRFGVDLPVQGLVQSPTVAAVARKLDPAAEPSPIAPPAPAPAAARSAPMTPTERTLMAIWQEVLCVRPSDVRDNFFDLGGEAVPIARLFEKIRARFGVDLPVRALIESPTIESLARVVDAVRPTTTLVVPMQPSGSGVPVFGIHDGGGYFFYRRLAARVGNRPFYAVQAETHLNGWRRPYAGSRGIEELASKYIREIQSVQPAGPYHLAGFSFGGVVAFEMARQLRRQGQQVATLFLLGSYVWNNPHREAAAAEGGTLPTRVRRRLARLLPAEARAAAWQQRPDGTMPASVLQRGVNLLALAKGEIAWRWAALGRRAIAPKTIHDRYLRASRLLISQYWPGDYEGRVVFFRATDDRDPVPVWQGLAAGGFALHEVEGRHTDLMREPMVDAVADLMRGYIDRADLEQATAVPACAAEAVPPACS